MSNEIRQHGNIAGKEYNFIVIEEGIVPISDQRTGAKSSRGYNIKYLDADKNVVAIGFSKTDPNLMSVEQIEGLPTIPIIKTPVKTNDFYIGRRKIERKSADTTRNATNIHKQTAER